MSVRWTKISNGMVQCSPAPLAHLTGVFTVAELQEGVRIAQEKPAFDVSVGPCSYRFQQRDGKVMYSYTSDGIYAVWYPAENDRVSVWSNECLEAILQARRS